MASSITTAYGPFVWSLILASTVVVLSIVPLGAARSKANFEMKDMEAPRAMFDRLPAWGKRASWAHQNSFESFSLHAPACLLCIFAIFIQKESTPLAIGAALLHPFLRLLYIGVYIGNIHWLRGLSWIGGLLCSAVLYSEGARVILTS
uniref:MAPEG family protein n=1 Tax=Paulinella chromatophora TaxID=39717 RepID=B1X3G0_PAUCH|nr:hypothetical protein PCC_0017 [Paulinella chromatophora]ACB42479.1 hypothetical protein PCC_0017 [Paulinella chromatophora]